MVQRQEGQGLVEYSLILLLVALAVVAALTVTADEIIDLYEYLMTVLPF